MAAQIPGPEVACLSFDITGDVAEWTLTGEQGAVRVALHRSFRHRLEHVLGDVSMSIISTHPDDAGSDVVRIFMIDRSKDTGRCQDVEELDRSDRATGV